jgi:ABC-type branched-subunit amino acid transport system substrate-binding protein
MRLAKTITPISIAVGTLLAVAPLAGLADVTVKIGFAAPLTGPNANYGKDLQNGVKMALDDAKANGIKIKGQTAEFTLIAEDDQADPRVGTQVAQKLVDEGVNVIVGHFNSGTTIPASLIYEKAGIPDIDPAATNPVISGRGLKNVFMVIASDAQNAGTAGNIDFIKLAGDAAENAMAWEYGRPLDSSEVGKNFADRYKQKFGMEVLSYAPFGYDAAWAAIKAMQAANSTSPNDYRAKLQSIDFDGITGKIAFNQDGSLKHGSSTMYQVKNGQWVTVVTKEGL